VDAPGLSQTPATERITLYCTRRPSALITRPQRQVSAFYRVFTKIICAIMVA